MSDKQPEWEYSTVVIDGERFPIRMRKITPPAIEGKVLWASSLGMEPASIIVEEVPEAQAVDYEGRKIGQPAKSVSQMLADPETRQLALDHIQAWTQITNVFEFTGGSANGYKLDAEAGIVTLLDDKTLEDCKMKFTDPVCFRGEPALPVAAKPAPAPLHPLQRLSSQPNGFGQSLWRPWEKQ